MVDHATADRRDAEIERLKSPPQSFEAEQSVIGGLMIAPDSWDKVADRVMADDFYRPDHRLIFATLRELVEARQPLDVITLSEALDSKGELERIGGLVYLGELVKNTPSAANIETYADIIRERALLRQLIAVSRESMDAAFQPEGRSSAQLLAEAENRLAAIAEGRPKDGGPQHITPLLREAVDKIDELFRSEGSITGLSTGFEALDNMTSGLQKSDLIVLAARPSMGKTTLAMNLVEHAVMSSDQAVVVFSLEMPASSLIMRMLSSLGRINQTRVRTGALEEDDWPKLTQAINKLKDRQLFIDDTPALSPMEMRARCKRIKREQGDIGLIMVDYLQLMQVPGRGDNRVAEISEISRSLKTIAKEFNCPMVALSQLNRGLEQRPNKRPVNSDLRDSGAIEQDADVIAFIYRDEVYNEDSPDKGVAEIIIGKQRNGPIGTCRLTFIGECTRFENMASRSYDYEQ